MSKDDGFDAMSDLCIEAARAVMQSGSEELQAVMRVALAVLGHDIAQRMSGPVNLPAERVSVSRRTH